MDWQNFRLSTRLQFSRQLTEAIYAKIAEIDAVKNTFHLTQSLLPQTIERLTQSVIVTSTGASNRIEGNRLSDEEVKALYRPMHIKSLSTDDEQEVAGYLDILQTIFGSYDTIPVSESSILYFHQTMLAFSNKDQRHRGQYKFAPNRVEAKDRDGKIAGVIFDPTPPHLTQKEISELIGWYDWATTEKFKHPLILIANFVFEYLAIHPFQDGNGRTSRLLTNLMLLRQDYHFVSLVSHERLIEQNKAAYYLALNKTQQRWKHTKEDLSPWLRFIFDIFHQQATEAQVLLESDQFEYLLSEKQLQLWQWAKQQNIFSRKTAIKALGFAPRTVEDITRKLLDMGKLERLGQGRATRYRVTD